ncbi:hypothetical protein PCE1_003240 [Barthelona sp. PCE]
MKMQRSFTLQHILLAIMLISMFGGVFSSTATMKTHIKKRLPLAYFPRMFTNEIHITSDDTSIDVKHLETFHGYKSGFGYYIVEDDGNITETEIIDELSKKTKKNTVYTIGPFSNGTKLGFYYDSKYKNKYSSIVDASVWETPSFYMMQDYEDSNVYIMGVLRSLTNSKTEYKGNIFELTFSKAADVDCIEAFEDFPGYDVGCSPLHGELFDHNNVSVDFLQRVKNVFPESSVIEPAFIDDLLDPNLHLLTSSYVNLTVVFEGAGFRNSFGYFTYDGSHQLIEEKLLFLDTSFRSDCLHARHTISIGPFEAGTNIGFFMISNGWNYPFGYKFYSLRKGDFSNGDGLVHVAVVKDEQDDRILLGFEDLWKGGDKDYNDLVFFAEVSGDLDFGNTPSVDDDGNVIDKPPVTETVPGDNGTYATGDNTNPDRVDNGNMPNITLPDGWVVAPCDNETIDIIIQFPWGCDCLVCGDGNSYFSANGTLCHENVLVNDTNGDGIITVGICPKNETQKVIIKNDTVISTPDSPVNGTDGNNDTVPVVNRPKWSFDITNSIEFNGLKFAVLDNYDPYATPMTGWDGCTRNGYSVPEGWRLAEDDIYTKLFMLLNEVYFGTTCLILENGRAVSTTDGTTCGTDWLYSGGNCRVLHKPKQCAARVLIVSGVADPLPTDVAEYEYTVLIHNETFATLEDEDPLVVSPSSCQATPLLIHPDYNVADWNENARRLLGRGYYGGKCLVFSDGVARKAVFDYTPGVTCNVSIEDSCYNIEICTDVTVYNFTNYIWVHPCHGGILLSTPTPLPEPEYWAPPAEWFAVYSNRMIGLDDSVTSLADGEHLLLTFDEGYVAARIEPKVGLTAILIESDATTYEFALKASADYDVYINGSLTTLADNDDFQFTIDGTISAMGLDMDTDVHVLEEDYVLTLNLSRADTPTIKIAFWSVHEDKVYMDGNEYDRLVMAAFVGMPVNMTWWKNATTLSFDSAALDYSDELVVSDVAFDTDVNMYTHFYRTLLFNSSNLEVESSITPADYICTTMGLTGSTLEFCKTDVGATNEPRMAAQALFVHSLFDIIRVDSVPSCDIPELDDIPSEHGLITHLEHSIILSDDMYATVEGKHPLDFDYESDEPYALPSGWGLVPWSSEARILDNDRLQLSTDGGFHRTGYRGRCIVPHFKHKHVLMYKTLAHVMPSLDNPSFESDLDDWTVVGPWAVENNTRTGVKAACVEHNEFNVLSYLKQTKTLNTTAPFAVSTWSSAENVTEPYMHEFYMPTYSLIVVVKYEDESTSEHFANFHLASHPYERAVVSVIPQKRTKSVSVMLQFFNVSGKVCFDAVNVEHPTSNLLLNPSMDYTIINEWFPLKFNVTVHDWTDEITEWMRDDHRYSQFWAGEGQCSYDVSRETTLLPAQIKGKEASLIMGANPNCTVREYGAHQNLILDQPEDIGNQIVYMSGWAKANSVSGVESSTYAIVCDITFQDDSVLSSQLITFPTGTYNWMYREHKFEVSKPIKHIDYYAVFFNRSGHAFFDQLYFTVVPTEVSTSSPRGTFGDPHIVTHTGSIYDMQVPGEFILSKDDKTEVQTRFEPVGVGTVVTAIAIKHYGEITEIRAGLNGADIFVNGTKVINGDVPNVAVRNGGTDIEVSCGETTVVISSRSTSSTAFFGVGIALDASVVLSEGLMGVAGAVSGSELTMRDGSAVDQKNDAAMRAFFLDWAIGSHESLFTYPDGYSPASFLDLAFEPATIDSFEAVDIESARAECIANGLKDLDGNTMLRDEFVEACIFDVLATSDNGFSTSARYFETQSSSELTLRSFTIPTIDVTPPDEVDFKMLVVYGAIIVGIAILVAIFINIIFFRDRSGSVQVRAIAL